MDSVLRAFLPQDATAERELFHTLDSTTALHFGLCLLILESLSLLEAYLNGRDEFGVERGLLRTIRYGIPSAGRCARLQALCDLVGHERLPPPKARGAELVSEVWRTFLASLPLVKDVAHPRSECVDWNQTSTRQSHLRRATFKISEIFRELTEDVRAFGYHGSIGSNDHVLHLSDCDAILILVRDVVKDAQRLERVHAACLRANRLMTAIDPFQHHGVFIIPEELFSYFPENYFPAVLFRSTAFDVGGGTTVRFQVIFAKWAALLQTFRLCRALDWSASRIPQANYYSLHESLQIAQVLPCLVTMCRGHSMNKRDAIPWFAERSSDDSRRFLGMTSDMRTRWNTIWPARLMSSRILSRWGKEKLLDRMIHFWGGTELLEQMLKAVARDGRDLAVQCVRGTHESP